MEHRIFRIPENVQGRFFTTSACIACGSCRVVAPKLFKIVSSGPNEGIFVVSKQPSSEIELKQMIEAYGLTFIENGPGPCIVDAEDLACYPNGLTGG